MDCSIEAERAVEGGQQPAAPPWCHARRFERVRLPLATGRPFLGIVSLLRPAGGEKLLWAPPRDRVSICRRSQPVGSAIDEGGRAMRGGVIAAALHRMHFYVGLHQPSDARHFERSFVSGARPTIRLAARDRRLCRCRLGLQAEFAAGGDLGRAVGHQGGAAGPFAFTRSASS